MGFANTSPPTPTSHVLTCISTLRWAPCCTACDIGGSVLCHPPTTTTTHIAVACTSCKAIFDPSFFTLHLTIFWVCSLLGHKGGVCVSLGGRCCISDLPLPEIGFGDIRTQGFGWAPSLPQPPSAEPAIMPSMSNRFSIKMQTSTSLSFSAAKYCPVEEQAAGSGGAVIP